MMRFDDEEKRVLRSCLENFRHEFNKLKYLGLYDSEQSILIREKTAKAIRHQTLDLYNNLGEDRASLDLAEFVSQIAGTSASKQKYNEEFEYLQGSKERNEKFEILKKNFDEINAEIKYMEDNPANLNLNYLVSTMNLIENKIVEIYRTEQENISEIDSVIDIFVLRLRSIAITLHNDYSKISESSMLLNRALKLSKSDRSYEAIQNDLITLRSNAEAKRQNENENIIFTIISWVIMFGIFVLIGSCGK